MNDRTFMGENFCVLLSLLIKCILLHRIVLLNKNKSILLRLIGKLAWFNVKVSPSKFLSSQYVATYYSSYLQVVKATCDTHLHSLQ